MFSFSSSLFWFASIRIFFTNFSNNKIKILLIIFCLQFFYFFALKIN
jgi:hypothetical protein